MEGWSFYEYSRYSQMLVFTVMGPAALKLSFAEVRLMFKVYISHGLALEYKCSELNSKITLYWRVETIN